MTVTMRFTRNALARWVLGACIAGCSAKSAETVAADTTVADGAAAPGVFTLTPEQQQRIHVIAVQATPYRSTVEATGTVAFNGDLSTQVLSPVSGPATRVVVSPGAAVQRGQPLAYVSSPDFAAAVAAYRKAQTAYRNAKRIADRDSALFQNDALARGELEQAQSDVAAADADLEAAVQQMRALGVDEADIRSVQQGRAGAIEAIIRAPIAGTVVEKLITPGQLLQAGTTPAFTIADLRTMWVMANVFANDLKDVAVGEPVDIFTDASSVPMTGRVDYVASLVDPGTKAVSVRILAPNVNLVLRKDMFVHVAIKAASERSGLLVPTSSVMRDEQNLPFVFIATKNGYLRRRIELGSRVGDRYAVVSGLASGDRVVAEGALFLDFAQSQ